MAVTLKYAMKYARKARDLERAYRAGSASCDVEKHRRQFKTHRNKIGVHFTFSPKITWLLLCICSVALYLCVRVYSCRYAQLKS